MSEKEHEEYIEQNRKWKERIKKTLVRIREEAKLNNEKINVTHAKLSAVRRSCPGTNDTILITLRDTGGETITVSVTIDKI